MRAAAALAAIVGASFLAGCGDESSGASRESVIAFARVSGAGVAIFQAHADGCCLEQLSHPPRHSIDASPSWSPDGKRLAFIRGSRTEPFRIYVMDADGGEAKAIPGGTVESGLSWSPDGKRILFAAPDGLRTISPSGGKTTLLVPGDAGTPSWSPDGKRIAFLRRHVFVADADGGNVRRLTRAHFPILEAAPTWSPDGKQVAYVEENVLKVGAFRPPLEIVSVDGSGARTVARLSPEATGSTTLAWSPDGKQFALSSVRDDTRGLFTVPVGGGALHVLVECECGDPSWSPVG